VKDEARSALGHWLLAPLCVIWLALASCPASCVEPSVRGPSVGGGSSGESMTLAAVAKQCARIASCAHTHDRPAFRNPSACVDEWIERAGEDPVVGCLASAASCDAVGACLHEARDPRSAAFCQAHSGEVTGCDGKRLVLCGDDPDESSSVDCAAFGAHCSALAQAGGLATHACVDQERCPAELSRAWCQGTQAVVSCHDGEIERTVCPKGSVCEAHTERDGDQAAMCEAPGHASCDALGSRRCDGSRLVMCEAHGHFGHEHSVDCAARGLACSVVDGRAACTNGAHECTARAASCEGSALSFCAGGKPARVECPELGFEACEADGRGPVATCRPGR
jgi:hypothetical protein